MTKWGKYYQSNWGGEMLMQWYPPQCVGDDSFIPDNKKHTEQKKRQKQTLLFETRKEAALPRCDATQVCV